MMGGAGNSGGWSIRAKMVAWMLCLLSVATTDLCGQNTYVLDRGLKPVPLSYQAGPGEEPRVVGVLNYELTLLNGQQVGSDGYVFSFAGEAEARLSVTVTVSVTRPNSRKNKGIQVAFPREAFGAMGRNAWKVDPRVGNPYGATLGHGESRTFAFTYLNQGAVGFNLPFVVTTESTPRNKWKLPAEASLSNHLLSKQIEVRGLLTAEDRMWNKSKDKFAGVATYLRAYPRGKYEAAAGEAFTDWLDGDFQQLVLDARTPVSIRTFIKRYTPYEDFNTVRDRLEAARRKLRGEEASEIEKVQPAVKPVRRRTRSHRIASPPVPAEEVATGTPDARIIADDDGIQTVKLYNFKRPAYYDIYGGLLEIDDTKMQEDGLIYIKQIKQGTVDFLVIERGDDERYASVALHNLMEVTMIYDDVLKSYELSIEGGVLPYSLYLQPMDGQRFDWGMDGIESTDVVIPMYDLQSSGLRGRYLAQVTSAGARRAVTIAGTAVDVPEMTGGYSWLYPLLIAMGIGLFALLLMFLLNRIGRRKRYLRDRQRVRV